MKGRGKPKTDKSRKCKPGKKKSPGGYKKGGY